MKQSTLLFIFTITIVFNSLGQFSDKEQQEIDSISSIINNRKSADTSLIKAYIGLSERLYLAYPDTDLYICKKIIEVAERGLNIEQDSVSTHILKSGMANATGNLGYFYKEKGDYKTSIEMYFKSLRLFEELNEKLGVAYLYQNIGFVYRHQEDFDQALEYYYKSLDIMKELNDQLGAARIMGNIGVVYEKQGKLEEALKLANESLSIRKELGDESGMAECYNNIGFIYDQRQEFDTAYTYYEKSMAILLKKGYIDPAAKAYANMGWAKHDLEQYEKAKELAQKGYELAKTNGLQESIKRNAELLSSIYKKENDFKQALNYYEEFISIGDSLKNEATQKAAIRQQTQYEFEKEQLIKEQQEKEVARIEAEKTQRRNNMQYSVILIAILVVFGIVLSLGFIKTSPKVAEGLIFFAFLIFFEFLLVLSDPYIDNFTGGAPAYKLLANALLAALIFPAHAFFERLLKQKIVSKTNRQ